MTTPTAMTQTVTTQAATTAAATGESGAARSTQTTAVAPNLEAAQCASEPTSPPIPVLAPYLGLVAAVLSTLGGGWLLLAPYALDFRHGAKHLPRAATVDLETGAAIIAVSVVAAVLFSVNLVLRLRGDDPADAVPVVASQPEEPPEADETAVTEPTNPKEPDPGGALRELLTPLVAALAADLRSHDQEQTQRKGP